MGNVYSLADIRARKSRHVEGLREVVMFVADFPDLGGNTFTREQLETVMLPRVRAKSGVRSAWMDGDKLIAQLNQK